MDMHYFELYTEFLADKRLQGVTPSTLRHYDDTVNHFFAWCRQEKIDLDEIALLPRWGKIWLTHCTERGLRPYTVHTYGRGLRTFLNWLPSSAAQPCNTARTETPQAHYPTLRSRPLHTRPAQLLHPTAVLRDRHA
jgi:site-specific recombinase XerC